VLFVSVGLTIRRPDTIANSRRGNIFFEIFAEFFDLVTRFFALLGFSLVLWILLCFMSHDIPRRLAPFIIAIPLLPPTFSRKTPQKNTRRFAQSSITSFSFFSFLPHL
jgi:hypothetical protein